MDNLLNGQVPEFLGLASSYDDDFLLFDIGEEFLHFAPRLLRRESDKPPAAGKSSCVLQWSWQLSRCCCPSNPRERMPSIWYLRHQRGPSGMEACRTVYAQSSLNSMTAISNPALVVPRDEDLQCGHNILQHYPTQWLLEQFTIDQHRHQEVLQRRY